MTPAPSSNKFLHELPEYHPERNKPLTGCFYRWKEFKTWKEIYSTMKIGHVTYNELSHVWTDNDVFCWSKIE